MVQYATPRNDRWGNTKAKERKRALEEDRTHNTERRIDEHGRNRIRHDVTENDAWSRVSKSGCCTYVVEVTHAQNLTAHETRNRRPARESDQSHDQPECAGFNQCNNRDNQKEPWKRDHDFDQA